jgi:hypothetical protein
MYGEPPGAERILADGIRQISAAEARMFVHEIRTNTAKNAMIEDLNKENAWGEIIMSLRPLPFPCGRYKAYCQSRKMPPSHIQRPRFANCLFEKVQMHSELSPPANFSEEKVELCVEIITERRG